MTDRDYITNVISLAKNIMEQNKMVLVYGKQAKRQTQMSYMLELDVS